MAELLVETYESQSLITESAAKEKEYFLEGICIQANIKNRNGRIYPYAVVKREVDKYITEFVNTNMAVGELNHPATDPSINYERVSHKYEWLKEDGNNWIGRAKVAHKTHIGSIVAGLMECGVVMGTSSRATGSTRLFEGAKVVQNDFRLITPGDIVYGPSAPDAYLTNLMEGREWVWANGTLIEREAEIKKDVNTLARTKKLDEKHMRALFESIVASIKTQE
jgi:hypothetical protein